MNTTAKQIMMNTLKLPSGATGFTNQEEQWVCTGSQGRSDTLPENRAGNIKLRMVRLQWTDGDYDQGGAYWGCTRDANGKQTFIYRAFSAVDATELFVRAKGRIEAKELVIQKLPGARFYR